MIISIQILLLFVLNIILINCEKKRNYLFNEFKDKTKSLKDLTVWKTKLKNDFISNLQKLSPNLKQDILKRGDLELTKQWESFLVTVYLEYKLVGSRNRFEEIESRRRSRLMNLVLAELLTANGKYMVEIANGLWLVLEQSTWSWPAHLNYQKAGVGLPDPKEKMIDLGVGETAAFVAWLQLLLGDKLDKIDLQFNKRINYEIDNRIVQPYLATDHWWSGSNGRKVNNWNVWINSNILITALLNLNDPKRLELIQKVLQITDNWVNSYGDDGGCDEGPAYWGEAAAKFIKIPYYLKSASNGQMDWSSNELFKKIGSYIYGMHIDKDYFVNFADSIARLTPPPDALLNYGNTYNDNNMKGFAAFFYKLSGEDAKLNRFTESGQLQFLGLQMSAFSQLKAITPTAPQPLETWFPDLQVLTLRSTAGSAKGLFLGAKAGHNNENHNHNDIGNFIIYVNGLPALIDVGAATYNAKTFSKERYTIWNTQSQWHSTPTINGFEQKDGKEFKATHVHYKPTKNGGVFDADIAGAYPPEAHVKSWVRSLTFDRTVNTIELSEVFALTKHLKHFKLHFITSLTPTISADKHEILLTSKDTKLIMHFNSKEFDVVVDSHKTEDPKISKVWGETVNRVTLVSKHTELKGEHKIKFHL